MKTVALSLGVILIFAGVIVASISAQANEKTHNELVKEAEDLPSGEWIISGEFERGDRLVVYFTPPNRGDAGPVPAEPPEFRVYVYDPVGGNTTFNVTFTKYSYETSVMHNDGGLLVDEPLGVGGLMQYEGNYTVEVWTWLALRPYFYPAFGARPAGTLPALELYKTIGEKSYPNLIALPIGIGTVVSGAVLSMWASRGSKRSSKSRSRR